MCDLVTTIEILSKIMPVQLGLAQRLIISSSAALCIPIGHYFATTVMD